MRCPKRINHGKRVDYVNSSFKISIALSVSCIFFSFVLFSLNKKTSYSAGTNKHSDCNYRILVPNVVGQDYTKACEEYNLVKVLEEHSGEKEGVIIKQSPVAGSISRENEIILTTVSKGRRETEVPFVLGKTIGEASICLSESGFIPKAVTVPSTCEEGIVVNYHDISYEKGMKLPKGQEIVLEVSG